MKRTINSIDLLCSHPLLVTVERTSFVLDPQEGAYLTLEFSLLSLQKLKLIHKYISWSKIQDSGLQNFELQPLFH